MPLTQDLFGRFQSGVGILYKVAAAGIPLLVMGGILGYVFVNKTTVTQIVQSFAGEQYKQEQETRRASLGQGGLMAGASEAYRRTVLEREDEAARDEAQAQRIATGLSLASPGDTTISYYEDSIVNNTTDAGVSYVSIGRALRTMDRKEAEKQVKLLRAQAEETRKLAAIERDRYLQTSFETARKAVEAMEKSQIIPKMMNSFSSASGSRYLGVYGVKDSGKRIVSETVDSPVRDLANTTKVVDDPTPLNLPEIKPDELKLD